MIACRYFSSSLLRFPLTPTIGWLQRVTVAWLSGWIHDSTYAQRVEGCHSGSSHRGFIMASGNVETHRNPPFSAERRHPLHLLIWDVHRHGECGRVGVAELVVVVDLCYPPALVRDALQSDAIRVCKLSVLLRLLQGSRLTLEITCLLYSERASYTFHPFSGKTCPYSKANICCVESMERPWSVREQRWAAASGNSVWWRSLTSPLETGKANFISTSKMDFLSVSSICLCANRRLRISCKEEAGLHFQSGSHICSKTSTNHKVTSEPFRESTGHCQCTD